jgi:flagellar hook assembly protein FlgD
VTNTPTITPTQGPDIFHVAQNAFNPPAGSVSIYINTPTLGDYKMKIYNSAGEFINDLGLGTPTAGTSHSFSWNGTDAAGGPCASGVYIIYYRNLFGAHMAKVILLR